ncbi:cysteine hydrolase family protein [Peribacillus kribbensis]|uniref:cysteine hydrolase family protein n=1 Tax=Peribacillus kribbensis TaxID=356658 RepID=UPI000418BEDA|nr:cysteine hydrolase family protein [Peribacillus kribbensis]
MIQFKNIPALLILDVQQGFDDPYWGERNNPEAEHNISRLLDVWRRLGWQVIYSQHLSLQPQSPLYYKHAAGIEFKKRIAPLAGESVFTKNVNSAFIGTSLEVYLNEKNIQTLVITGLATQHCVSTTTRMSKNLGFNNYLVWDASAAFEITDHRKVRFSPEAVHEAEMAALHNEFATITYTEDILQAALSDGQA